MPPEPGEEGGGTPAAPGEGPGGPSRTREVVRRTAAAAALASAAGLVLLVVLARGGAPTTADPAQATRPATRSPAAEATGPTEAFPDVAPLRGLRASATSVAPAEVVGGRLVTWDAGRAVDGDTATTWRPAGDGARAVLSVWLPETATVSAVVLVAGADRPLPASLAIRPDDGSTEHVQARPDERRVRAELSTVALRIDLEVLSRGDVAIAEVEIIGVAAETAAPVRPTPGPARYVFPVQPADDAVVRRPPGVRRAITVTAPCTAAVVAVTPGVIEEVVAAADVGADEPKGHRLSLLGDDGVRYAYTGLGTPRPGRAAGNRVRAGAELAGPGELDDGCGLSLGASTATVPSTAELRRGVVDLRPYLEDWRAGRERSPTAEVSRRSRDAG